MGGGSHVGGRDGAPIAALPVATFIRTVRLDATGRRLIWTMTWSDGRESDSWLEEVPLDVPPYDTFVLPEATNNSRFGDIESEDEAASLFSMRWWKPAPTARVAAVISTKRLANDLDMIKWRLNKSELDQVNTPEQTRRTVGTHPPATPATRHHSFMWIRWTRRRAQARPPQTSVVCRETHLTSPIRSHRACAHPVSEFVHVTQKNQRERERARWAQQVCTAESEVRGAGRAGDMWRVAKFHTPETKLTFSDSSQRLKSEV